jgi:hypothetical protein
MTGAGAVGDGADGLHDRLVSFGGGSSVPLQLLRTLTSSGSALVPLHHCGWFPLLRIDGAARGSSYLANIVGSAGSALPLCSELGPLDGMPKIRHVQAGTPIESLSLAGESAFAIQSLISHIYLTSEAASTVNASGSRRAGVYSDNSCWATFDQATRRALGTIRGLSQVAEQVKVWTSLGRPNIHSYGIELDYGDVDSGSDARNCWTISRYAMNERISLKPNDEGTLP